MSLRKQRLAFRNPIGSLFIKREIHRDLKRLQQTAELQAWGSEHAPRLVTDCVKLLFVVAFGVQELGEFAGFSTEHPDIRIMRGMASALGDLAARPQDLEQHRAAIQSGLAAAERVMTGIFEHEDTRKAAIWALGVGTQELAKALAGPGITVHTIERLLGYHQ